RRVVQPDGVATLDGDRPVDAAHDGDSGRLESRDGRLGLVPPPLLAGREQARAVASDEGRVVRVDRIGIAGVVLGYDDLGAGIREVRAERLVLRLRRSDVRGGPPT